MGISDFGMVSQLIQGNLMSTSISSSNQRRRYISKHPLEDLLILFGSTWLKIFGLCKMHLVELGNINNPQIIELKYSDTIQANLPILSSRH